MVFPFTNRMRDEYNSLFDSCEIPADRLAQVDAAVTRMAQNRSRYELVANELQIPWHFVAIIHCMESGTNFNCHLHNGDPLTARTVHAPPGRPVSGAPLFTWEQSAADALAFKRVNDLHDWSISGTLYQLEKYNGFGYRNVRPATLTPYLWSFSNHYMRGKFVSDGKFDREAVSAQCGSAALLQRMLDRGIVTLPAPPAANPILQDEATEHHAQTNVT